MLDKNIIDSYNLAFDSNLQENIIKKANILLREEASSVILEKKIKLVKTFTNMFILIFVNIYHKKKHLKNP